MAAVALDTRLGCLEPGPAAPHCSHIIEAVQQILRGSKRLDSGLRLWQVLPSRQFEEFCQNYRTFKHISHTIIEAATEQGGTEKRGLVGELGRAGCPADMISVTAAELLFGGVDTTAHSLVFTLYLLARNPASQQRLQEELSTAPGLPASLPNLPFLRAVLKAVMPKL